MTIKFDENTELGKKLYEWWQDLQKHRGERAQLRRAKNVTEIILLPAFQRACMRFRPFFQNEENWEVRLAAIIGISSHVRTLTNQKLASQMAGNPPSVSQLRFRRLLQNDRKDIFITLIRTLRLLDNKANLHDLANSVYYWGDDIKRKWAFTYFPEAPDSKSA